MFGCGPYLEAAMSTLMAKRKDNRIELRAEPEFVSRLTKEADRFGLSLSAYLRLAATEKMERDHKPEDQDDRVSNKGRRPKA
jgi:pilus assembly protein TadC